MEIIQSEEQKEKEMKKNEQSLRGRWDTLNNTNVHITEVLEGKGEKERGRKHMWKNNDQERP